MKSIVTAALCSLVLASSAALAQAKASADKPADDMQILRDKIAADKKLVISVAMELTEAEAKGFWPVYDEYQKGMQKINEGLATVISDYAKEYTSKSLTDDKARRLLDRYMALEDDQLRLRKAILPKVAEVLPGRKVARYMQIENKVRAVVMYELASEIPLAQ